MNGGLVEAGQAKALTLSERLANEEKTLVERLEEIRILRRQLEQNSGIQVVIDGITKLGYFNY